MSEIAIQVQDLKKQYKGSFEPALNGLNLTVPQNKIFGLLGPNGAGKSTTIHIICGVLKGDSGHVEVLGEDVTHNLDHIRRNVGFVPQGYALFPDLSARENLEYIGTLYGIDKPTLTKKIDELLSIMGLTDHANKSVKKYSGGMKRRANIIASLLHDPQILILDEPTAGVDVQSRNTIIEFLKNYNQQGKTIIYTSHLLDEAERLCDEIAIIDNGQLVISGATQKIIQGAKCTNLEQVFLHYTGNNLRDYL